ncbi:MAG: YigZ family protein, partial [Muribaculaceae bacterium]|nr:YigZ family protein [Muribaculaceae bacterium]
MADSYFTISREGAARYTEKMSRFLAFARKVKDGEEARRIVKEFQNEYHDARHVCWAYVIGPERKEWQLNDNGEPSGTAGKPILGQINSRELSDVLVVVVRY